MPVYNSVVYSDNYSRTSGSLWQFKRDETNINLAGIPANVSRDNSTSFKYKQNILKKEVTIIDEVFKNLKIAVPPKHFSNFWRSSEMSLINCKIHLELN